MKKHLLILVAIVCSTVINAQNSVDIYDAARNGDVFALTKIIKDHPESINSKNAQGYTAIILACYYNRIEVIKFLLKKEVELNNAPNSPTVLQAAAYKGFDEAVELLLNYGANPNIVDANGTSPLIYAAQFKHQKIVELLVKKEVDVNYKDLNGFTALDYAVKLEFNEIIELLSAH